MTTLEYLARQLLDAVEEGNSDVNSSAHDEVARECDRFGGFCYGDQVYECKRKNGEVKR